MTERDLALTPDGPESTWTSGARLAIDLGAIRANYRTVCQHLVTATMGAVLKSDAYGLGLEPVARLLLAEGCRHFWVNDPDEGMRIQALAPKPVSIFLLHGLQGHEPAAFAGTHLIPVLNARREVEQCLEEAGRRGTAVPVGIQLDTGLGRLGLASDDIDALAHRPGQLEGLDVRCWLTQLSCYAEPHNPHNALQRDRLRQWSGRLVPAPLSLVASAGATLLPPDWHGDLVRVGSALYGIRTTADPQPALARVVSLTAPVLRVAHLPAGQAIGYGCSHPLDRPSRIATVAAGYADGLPPPVARGGHFYLGGHPAPIVGGLAMNLTMVDVTDLPSDLARPGANADVIGDHQTVEQLAHQIGWTPNAILTHLGGCARRGYREAPMTEA